MEFQLYQTLQILFDIVEPEKYQFAIEQHTLQYYQLNNFGHQRKTNFFP